MRGAPFFVIILLVLVLLSLTGCQSVSHSGPPPVALTVTRAGSGSGTVTSTPAGINCGTSCSGSFSAGTSVVLTATPAANNTFDGWSGACSGKGSCTVVLNQASSVTATFSGAVQLSVKKTGTGTGTITSAPAGIDCGSSCTASFATGTTLTLTAVPDASSTFSGWSGVCSGTGTCQVTVTQATTVSAAFAPAATAQLSVALAGYGTGTVTSSPAGINCPANCVASFPVNTTVSLTAQPNPGFPFGGWSGACTGSSPCTINLTADNAVTARFDGSLKSLNHIVILAQENRSFDHYFGALREYWAQNGFPDQPFDGLAQFNIPAGAAPTNPGCDPAYPYDPNANPPLLNDCVVDSSSPTITSFHLASQCIENPSPSWNESHVDRNLADPTNATAALDGFVQTAANNSRRNSGPPDDYLDFDGHRAMGFYDGSDLNYYYFMASSFATSDRWFAPVMTRTQPNRMYMIAATSEGRVYPPSSTLVKAKTIFEELEAAGITWKIYVQSLGTSCADTDSACLINYSSIGWFVFGWQMKQDPTLLAHVQSVNQYLKDAQNGTLPSVALIEPSYGAALDEHPTVQNAFPTRIQAGAKYVSSLINSLMNSPSWKDSAFIFTFDEGGGLYDHVAPYSPVPNPDGIQPADLRSGDICLGTPNAPTCDFTYTGYRVPLMVVSPFTKKNYVSHTPTDHTAMLKLIETRFGLPTLTKRDAWAIDMTEFFDFVNAPWATPPSPPAQITTGACTLTPP